MTFSVFVSRHIPDEQPPMLWYLSGLTGTHANVTDKGKYRCACAQHGVIFIAPDSPRGEEVADDPAYAMRQSAGFHVAATETPWSRPFQMRRYVEEELPALIAAEFRPTRDAKGSWTIR